MTAEDQLSHSSCISRSLGSVKQHLHPFWDRNARIQRPVTTSFTPPPRNVVASLRMSALYANFLSALHVCVVYRPNCNLFSQLETQTVPHLAKHKENRREALLRLTVFLDTARICESMPKESTSGIIASSAFPESGSADTRSML